MITDKDTWVLINNEIPFYIPENQEFSTNNNYEEFDNLESFITKLDELGIEYNIDYLKPRLIEKLANWDNFNLQMMSNPRFNEVYSQCLSVAPIVANALPTALDQVTSKGTSLFTLIWNQLCSIGGATNEDREIWGNYAIQNNLPLDFTDILKGNNLLL